MADLTIGTPQNPYTAIQSADASSACDASAQWATVVADRKTAGNRVQPAQTATTHDGASPNQTGASDQAGGQKLPRVMCIYIYIDP